MEKEKNNVLILKHIMWERALIYAGYAEIYTNGI